MYPVAPVKYNGVAVESELNISILLFVLSIFHTFHVVTLLFDVVNDCELEYPEFAVATVEVLPVGGV